MSILRYMEIAKLKKVVAKSREYRCEESKEVKIVEKWSTYGSEESIEKWRKYRDVKRVEMLRQGSEEGRDVKRVGMWRVWVLADVVALWFARRWLDASPGRSNSTAICNHRLANHNRNASTKAANTNMKQPFQCNLYTRVNSALQRTRPRWKRTKTAPVATFWL